MESWCCWIHVDKTKAVWRDVWMHMWKLSVRWVLMSGRSIVAL